MFVPQSLLLPLPILLSLFIYPSPSISIIFAFTFLTLPVTHSLHTIVSVCPCFLGVFWGFNFLFLLISVLSGARTVHRCDQPCFYSPFIGPPHPSLIIDPSHHGVDNQAASIFHSVNTAPTKTILLFFSSFFFLCFFVLVAASPPTLTVGLGPDEASHPPLPRK